MEAQAEEKERIATGKVVERELHCMVGQSWSFGVIITFIPEVTGPILSYCLSPVF